MHATLPLLQVTGFPAIHRAKLTTLQVNLGYMCNQSCVHCHVNAGPNRTEMMDDANLALVHQALQSRGIETLDLTGGAPELHPAFRAVVSAARALGVRVIDRCNLTILFEPGQEGLANSRHWISSLDKLLAFDAKVIVPGHGSLSLEARKSRASTWFLCGPRWGRRPGILSPSMTRTRPPTGPGSNTCRCFVRPIE